MAPVPKCCREEVEVVEAGKAAKMDEIYQKLKLMGLEGAAVWRCKGRQGSASALQYSVFMSAGNINFTKTKPVLCVLCLSHLYENKQEAQPFQQYPIFALL